MSLTHSVLLPIAAAKSDLAAMSIIRVLFECIDAEKDGKIDKNDLGMVLEKFQLPVTKDSIEDLLKVADLDASGDVSFGDFEKFCFSLEIDKLDTTKVDPLKYLLLWWIGVSTSRSILVQSKPQKLPGSLAKVSIVKNPMNDALKTLISGGIAGAISRTIVSPLERVKILFQTQGTPPKYTSIAQCLRVMFQEEGFRGLFKGNWANCLRVFPASATQFYTYGEFKKMFASENGEITSFGRLCAGAMAGTTAQVVTYPLDFIRTRLTVDGVGGKSQYKGVIHCAQSVYRAEGWTAFYKGMVPSLVGVVPYAGLDFAVYESLKAEVPKRFKDQTGQPNSYAKLACGGIAGLVGQTVAFPLDLVRRRIQIQGIQNGLKGSSEKYSGMFEALISISRREGLKGLYRGLIPNYIKSVPAVALSFTIFEHLNNMVSDL
jgi:solute carrier family 25 phosphate transporter 23/24/25/41